LDHFEEKFAKIITDFLVKKVRSGSDLAKKFRIRIHHTGFSVPDFFKRKLIVDTNISDLHRIHSGSGSEKGKINADLCGYKTLVGTPTVHNGLVASI
jgi:hypothetical protein